MTKDCSGRVTPKRVPGACSWRQAGERLALLPGAHGAAYAGHGSASNSGFFSAAGALGGGNQTRPTVICSAPISGTALQR